MVWFKKIYIGCFWCNSSLLKGMRMTGYYFTHRKEIITQNYPDKQHLKLPERFRGEVVMPHDEKNEHACTGCTACELACPNATIKIITKFDVILKEKRKKHWTLLYIILNFAPCVISVSKPVQPMRSRWRRILSIVFLTEANYQEIKCSRIKNQGGH